MATAVASGGPGIGVVVGIDAARERAVTEYRRRVAEHRDIEARLKESKFLMEIFELFR